jgi:hypothetical protein
MPSPRKLRIALIGLLEKYRVLARLRSRREEVEAEGRAAFSGEESARRIAEFRRVARDFPGALRELDSLTAGALFQRAREVEEEIELAGHDSSRRAPARIWVAVTLDYHDALREALAVKMWLAQNLPAGKQVSGDLVSRFRGWFEDHPSRRSEGPLGAAFLARHRRPPGGRLHALVWSDLELRHGRGRRELERLIFGSSRGAAGRR